jgi:hypothetical protein
MAQAGKTLRRRLVYATTLLLRARVYILKARPHNNNPLTHSHYIFPHLPYFFSLIPQQLHLPACCHHSTHSLAETSTSQHCNYPTSIPPALPSHSHRSAWTAIELSIHRKPLFSPTHHSHSQPTCAASSDTSTTSSRRTESSFSTPSLMVRGPQSLSV